MQAATGRQSGETRDHLIGPESSNRPSAGHIHQGAKLGRPCRVCGLVSTSAVRMPKINCCDRQVPCIVMGNLSCQVRGMFIHCPRIPDNHST